MFVFDELWNVVDDIGVDFLLYVIFFVFEMRFLVIDMIVEVEVGLLFVIML